MYVLFENKEEYESNEGLEDIADVVAFKLEEHLVYIAYATKYRKGLYTLSDYFAIIEGNFYEV